MNPFAPNERVVLLPDVKDFDDLFDAWGDFTDSHARAAKDDWEDSSGPLHVGTYCILRMGHDKRKLDHPHSIRVKPSKAVVDVLTANMLGGITGDRIHF